MKGSTTRPPARGPRGAHCRRALLGTALAALGAACGGGAPSASALEPATDLEHAGRALYRGAGACSACHGADGGGTMLGPALAGRAARWDMDRLAAYLADPAAYAAEHPEVQHQRMPQPATTEPEELSALAAWTLRLMQG